MEKVCIITGADGGIGVESARFLKRDGWRLVASGLGSPSRLEHILDGEDLFIVADLSQTNAADHLCRAALHRFGRLDGLLHCAGTSHVGGFPDQEDDGWDRVIDINLSAAHRMARASARAMLKSGNGGSIVLISSIAWLSGGANPAYGAAKGGVNTLAYNIAQAVGPDSIRANAIAPGIIETEMVRAAFPGDNFKKLEAAAAARTPLRRLGKPSDVAEVAAFLLSDRAAFVTGAVVPVTGGIELLPPIGHMIRA